MFHLPRLHDTQTSLCAIARFDSVFLARSFSNSIFPLDGDRILLVVPLVVKPQLNLNADRVEQKLDLVLGLVV